MGAFFGFLWFFLLFIAGVTSSISLALPAVAFLEDEFNLNRREAVAVFAVVAFLMCQPVIFFVDDGVLDEMDFWGGTVGLVVFGTIEAILFAWVFGMERAWTELHVGSDIRIPRFYRWIIRFVTPTFLLAILGVWLWQDWWDMIVMKNVTAEHKPFVIMTRIGLLGVFVFLAMMVYLAWKRRPRMPETTGSPNEPSTEVHL